MKFPKYYEQVEKIKIYDPLSRTLGSLEDGIIEFSFIDLVKVAGHGCPTVGGAYLMAAAGLKYLYQNDLPCRGKIELHLRTSKEIKTTGVIANIIGTIIGASDEGGFKGLGGLYARNNLVKFNQTFDGDILLKRIDNGKSVSISYHPEIVPGNPNTSKLLSKILEQESTISEEIEFQKYWNERLEKIMILGSTNNQLIKVISE
jgi:hypothetical protein